MSPPLEQYLQQFYSPTGSQDFAAAQARNRAAAADYRAAQAARFPTHQPRPPRIRNSTPNYQPVQISFGADGAVTTVSPSGTVSRYRPGATTSIDLNTRAYTPPTSLANRTTGASIAPTSAIPRNPPARAPIRSAPRPRVNIPRPGAAVTGGLVNAGVTAALVKAGGGSNLEAAGYAAGSGLGAAGGAKAGFAVGMALGGPVGAGIGAVTGSLLGDAIGQQAARHALGALPPGAAQGLDSQYRNTVTPQALTGGQSPGVTYSVQLVVQGTTDNGFQRSPPSGFESGTLIGPISLVEVQISPSVRGLALRSSTGDQLARYLDSNPVGLSAIPIVARADGQPDTGGNPPPIQTVEEVPPNPERSLAPAVPALAAAAGSLSGVPVSPRSPSLPSARPGAPLALPTPTEARPPSPTEASPSGKRPAPVPGPTAQPVATVGSGATATPIPGTQPVPGLTTSPQGELVRQRTPETTSLPYQVAEATSGAALPELRRNPDGSVEVIPNGNSPAINVGGGIIPGVATLIPAAMPASHTAPGLRPLPNRGPRGSTGAATGVNSRTVNAPQNQVQQPPPQGPGRPTTTPNPCGCNKPVLDALGKLAGSPVPGLAAEGASLGAIMAKLNKMQEFAEKAWESTRIQKMLDVLTFVGVMHNAAFLSREVGETFGYALGNMLAVIGIRDENGSPLDIQGIVGSWTNQFFVAILGQETVNGITQFWNKASSILRSASMIIWTIRGIFDASQDLMEWIGENVSSIGNALRKYNVVGRRAYGPMSPIARSKNRWRQRLDKYFNTLENAEDVGSSFAMATSNVLEIQQEVGELNEQRQQFAESFRDFTEGADPDNSQIPIQDAQVGPDSQSQDITPNDFGKGEAT